MGIDARTVFGTLLSPIGYVASAAAARFKEMRDFAAECENERRQMLAELRQQGVAQTGDEILGDILKAKTDTKAEETIEETTEESKGLSVNITDEKIVTALQKYIDDTEETIEAVVETAVKQYLKSKKYLK